MRAAVMGILNVTPDSFSDGGSWLAPERAIEQGKRMFSQGADIVDVGGESTRPGSRAVSVDEECSRVLPVVEQLREYGTISIDTMKREVAEAAIAAGASMLNDISASLEDVAAAAGVPWVAMHMQQTPETMQLAPTYDDVVSEVRDFLVEAAQRGNNAGVPRVLIDPGFGFGKTVEHNVALLRSIETFVETRYDVLVGLSRKSFLGVISSIDSLASNVPTDRLGASLGAAMWCVLRGAAVVRVHDVGETAQLFRMMDNAKLELSPQMATALAVGSKGSN